MGRDARRPRPPNWGDAERRVHAKGAFVVALWSDLRVQEHYLQWGVGRDLPRLWRQMDATRSRADIRACAAAMASPATPAERAALVTLAADLGLRFTEPEPEPWIVAALDVLFRVSAHNEVAAKIGIPPKMLDVELAGLGNLPPGRRARHSGDDVERDARWVYRHFVRRGPTDSISALGDEWAEQEKRGNDCRSVPQNGIDRGVLLLDLANRRSQEGGNGSK